MSLENDLARLNNAKKYALDAQTQLKNITDRGKNAVVLYRINTGMERIKMKLDNAIKRQQSAIDNVKSNQEVLPANQERGI